MKKTITKEYYICEECKKMITEPLKAVIVKGNIHIANYDNSLAEIGSGIIGNNYKHNDSPDFKSWPETSYHDKCFLRFMLKTLDLIPIDLDY